VRAVEPDEATAPAEAGDGEAPGVTFAAVLRPGEGRIEIGKDLVVGYLHDHLFDDVLNLLDPADVTLALIQIRRDREVAGFGEPPTQILYISVQAEDFMDQQDDRRRGVRVGAGAIARDRAVG